MSDEKASIKQASTDSIQFDCRICMCEISPVTDSVNVPDYARSILLKNPCACKGTLSYVHEACLVKWLL